MPVPFLSSSPHTTPAPHRHGHKRCAGGHKCCIDEPGHYGMGIMCRNGEYGHFGMGTGDTHVSRGIGAGKKRSCNKAGAGKKRSCNKTGSGRKRLCNKTGAGRKRLCNKTLMNKCSERGGLFCIRFRRPISIAQVHNKKTDSHLDGRLIKTKCIYWH